MLVGRRIYARMRWRQVAALQPQRDLLLIGEYRTTTAENLVRAGLFIDPVQLSLQPVEAGAVSRSIGLSEVRGVSVVQLDSSIAWATNLDIELPGDEALSITLDGWRLRSRTRLFDEASAAAARIRAAAGLAPVPFYGHLE